MKKCLVCKKQIDEKEEDTCYSCIGFFQWKYGKNWKIPHQRFLNLLKKTSSLETTKLNRRYKNE